MAKLKVEVDPSKDLVIVDGISYSGEFFRWLGQGGAVGRLFRLTRLADQTVTLEELRYEPDVGLVAVCDLREKKS
jgi:hypothetical protein